MSRRRRGAMRARLRRTRRRPATSLWLIVLLALVALAIGLARSFPLP